MANRQVYQATDIPDIISLGAGKTLSILRFAKQPADVIRWAEEHHAIIGADFDPDEHIMVALRVDPSEGLWLLLHYGGSGTLKLSHLVALTIPKGVTVESAQYDDLTDCALLLSSDGSVATSIRIGYTASLGSTPRPPEDYTVPTIRSRYEYPHIPACLQLGSKSIKPVLTDAEGINQIVAWVREHEIRHLRSVGANQIVLFENVGSGVLVNAVLVYTWSTVDRASIRPWHLTFIGMVNTGVYAIAGAYLDKKIQRLVLTDSYGDKVAVLELKHTN